ncbi:MAG: acetylglutamate kinase [Gracilimonas sp.]|uniref:acetylglutamate kinase n=1 Tax=Gracilimonas sp. TaxID=1974203 RepID=UPI00198F0E6E|nr:acetylglutamate kinase [Gracilimonas sp.]MBD3617427.1 acetylglutamate kinase [Gracilimonas sp.]
MSSVKVVKIGGKIIDDDQILDAFLKDFVSIKEPKILVHGGGAIASKIGKKLGITPNMIEGRRITDEKSLEVITMVYGGLVNKKIVAKLQAFGKNAVGLSGADLNIIPAKKRNPKPVDFGWVGDIDQVNSKWLLNFLNQDITPVLAPLTHDGKGNMLNTNADSIASAASAELAKTNETELIFCFEKPGVMNKEKLITEINLLLYRHLRDIGLITDGMIPKIDLGFQALKNGVKTVSIRSFKSVSKITSGTQLIT